MNADGSDETRLTTNEALSDVAPNWSPDGARIVWAHQPEPGPDQTDLYVMSADGSDQVPVTSSDSFENDPAWSPDGKRIVFQTQNLLWTINPDGTDAQPLTGGDVPTETSDRSPDWGPAGSEPPGQIADLSVVKSENFDPITAGDQLTYAISIANFGPGTAENVVLTDPLPAGVAFVNTTTSAGTCAHDSGVVTCQLGSLAAGASAVVTIVVVPAAAGTLENTATVTTTSFDPNALNNSESEQTTVAGAPTPMLAIDDVSVTEGNAGTSAAVFTVTKTGAGAATVDWATAAGSATAGSDFTAASGSLSFAGPSGTQTIVVQVVGDTLSEPSETFFVNLSNPGGASISDGQGIGTIVDDDASAPTLPLKIEGPCSEHGTLGDDEITGNSTANWICGWGGADTILGLAGEDRLLGGAGADDLAGGLGDDELEGGAGDDVIDSFGEGADDVDGGSGFDTCYCGPEDDLTSIERRISHGR